ncbi:TPA: hypothetical protein ACGORE_001742 [Streptococcus suis]
MATTPQPAKKSYFFGKGYVDLGNTIKGAWQRNFDSIKKYKDHIADSHNMGDGKVAFIFKLILNVLAMISVSVFGSIITLVISAINIVVLLLFMAIVYIGFSVIWLVDRIYLMRKKIFTACHECKEKSLIPTYICPKCGAKHTNLTPGVYGILHRTCVGEDPNSYCGEKLPTTFFNGRRNLDAICPHCSTPLMDRESVPICIPIVGGRSVGKTAFITAFSKEFIDEVAPTKSWDIEFYNDKKEEIYKEIQQDYSLGSTRMTDRPSDINKASSISFSFFVKGKEFSPERLVHVYDIAGEVFTDNNENEIQKQYEYCQGMVLMIDPFAIPSVRHRCEEQLSPEDIAGIGKADINSIVDSFLNKLREVTGLSDQKMSSVPLAVIIGKIDSAGLTKEIGDEAIKQLMAQKPETFKDYFDTQDYLCRKFLTDNGMESFINSVDIKFKDNRYFSCTAIGHTRDKGQYNPQGVLPPMEWIFGKADSKMSSSWNDIKFSKKITKIVENANV